MTDIATDDAATGDTATDGGEPTFSLGVAMAGAISAGAYTAGVLDFLVRALEQHDASVGQPGGPTHRVALKAMSGASAGGICAALATAGLIEGPRLKAARMTEGDDQQIYNYVLRPLHEIWVERVDLAQGDALLALGDLRKGELRSLINSDVLDRQAEQALAPVTWDGRRRGWLADELELFLTTTDLDGVPYVAPFNVGAAVVPGAPPEGHAMARHAFARHFRLAGLGMAPGRSAWLDVWGDDGVPLTLPEPGTPLPFHEPGQWCELRLTAFASGAFPGGLASRHMSTTLCEFSGGPDGRGQGGAMPLDIDPSRRPLPSDPWFSGAADTPLSVHAVDGGVCNNEPFELVRFALRSRLKGGEAWRLAPNPRGKDDVDRAVIMIDPFPEGPVFTVPEARKKVGGLGASLAKLLPTLLNQARFKPMELLQATDPGIHSRWLVAPSRRAHDDEAAPSGRRALRLDTRGAEAIASGCLGGFGGFLHDGFRRHDFILGQRNCQSFLINHFGLAPGNPILGGWTGPHLQADGDVPILNLPDHLREPIALPPWPSMPPSRLKTVKRKVDDRIDRVVEMLLKANLNGIGRFMVGVGYRFGGRNTLRGQVRGRIDAALKAWELR